MKNKSKNGFLITWISCIAVLLVVCFIGVSKPIKGTQAKKCYIYNGIETCVNDDVNIGGGSYTSKPDSYTPGDNDDGGDSGDSGGGGGNGGSGTTVVKPGGGVYNCDASWVHCNSDGSYTTTLEGADGSTTTVYHDKNGNFVSNKTTYKDGSTKEYDYDNKTTTYTDANGAKTIEKTKDYDNGTYSKTITKPDGSKVVENYDPTGKLLSVITTDANGNQSISNVSSDSTIVHEGNLTFTTFYKSLEQCNYMHSEGSGSCGQYGEYYITSSEAKFFSYDSKEACETATGGDCLGLNDVYVSCEIPSCEDIGTCDEGEEHSTPVTPSPAPTLPKLPARPDSDEDDPYNPPSSNPKPSSKPSSSNDRGDGCYKNKDTGEFKWFDNDPELNSNTDNYEKVNDSNCKHNVTDNPQTGEIAMFFIWIIAFCAVGYSVWYYVKSRKES